MELKNKTVLFLGSSVTFGSASGGVSFADMMEEQCGLTMVKEALSGTTLADIDDGSYVARLKKVNPKIKMDLVIVQLSTNDAGRNTPMPRTILKQPRRRFWRCSARWGPMNWGRRVY